MISSYFYHTQLNIDFDNVRFYKDFMHFIGWSIIFETEGVIGFKSKTNGDVWLVKASINESTNYDAKGTNHISFRVNSQTDVDTIKGYLESKGIKMLFGTPKHRPEFANTKDETYYQIMFETPDKLLFEVVYIGINET